MARQSADMAPIACYSKVYPPTERFFAESIFMVILKDLTELIASGNLTEAQIVDLISTLTVMRREDKGSKKDQAKSGQRTDSRPSGNVISEGGFLAACGWTVVKNDLVTQQ